VSEDEHDFLSFMPEKICVLLFNPFTFIYFPVFLFIMFTSEMN